MGQTRTPQGTDKPYKRPQVAIAPTNVTIPVARSMEDAADGCMESNKYRDSSARDILVSGSKKGRWRRKNTSFMRRGGGGGQRMG